MFEGDIWLTVYLVESVRSKWLLYPSKMGNKGINRQLVCDLSFKSVDNLDIVQTGWRAVWEFIF